MVAILWLRFRTQGCAAAWMASQRRFRSPPAEPSRPVIRCKEWVLLPHPGVPEALLAAYLHPMVGIRPRMALNCKLFRQVAEIDTEATSCSQGFYSHHPQDSSAAETSSRAA
jgi:hypothetical protein